MEELYVVKKNGSMERFNDEKIIKAITKSAERVMVSLTEEEESSVISLVKKFIEKDFNLTVGMERVTVSTIHIYVEVALSGVNERVAKSYKDYRNYKTTFVDMLDEAYSKSQSIMFRGDKENSNTDSALVATKRVLSYNEINRLFYKKFFLTEEEIEAIEKGYIYIHDASSRRDTYNCCLFDAENVMRGGFEMGNMWYNEPTDIDKALDVLGDILSVKAGQQYGKLNLPL